MALKFFDPADYLQQNPDVAASARWAADPAGHYERYGRFEGRNPNPFFNEQFYLAHNIDVAETVATGAFASGYDHWISYGQFEDRSPLPVLGTISTSFVQQYEYRGAGSYLVNNPDVLAAYLSGEVSSAWEHYIRYGYAEERTSVLGVVAHGSAVGDIFNLDGRIQWNVDTGLGDDTVTVKEYYLIAGQFAYGDDYIDAGDGTDVVDGGWGRDIIVGGGGNDVLYGGDVPAVRQSYFPPFTTYTQSFEDRFVFAAPSLPYEFDVVASVPGQSFDPTDRLVLPPGIEQSDVLTFSDGEDWHVRYVAAGRVQEIKLDFLPDQAPPQFDTSWFIWT